MTNEYVEFEFRFRDQQLAVLPPIFVNELAHVLDSYVAVLVRRSTDEGSTVLQLSRGDLKVEFWLVGADRGSILLRFKPLVRRAQKNLKVSEIISTTNDAVDLFSKIWPLFVGAAVASGHIVVAQPTRAPTVKIEATQGSLADPQVVKHVDQLVKTALSSNADEVIIRIPDQPDIVLNAEQSGARVLGSTTSYAVEVEQPVTQQWLEVVEDGFDTQLNSSVTIDGSHPVHTRTMLGQVDVNGEKHIVVVVWQSKRARPHVGQTVIVSGKIESFASADLKIKSAIPNAARGAVGVLTVTSQLLEE